MAIQTSTPSSKKITVLDPFTHNVPATKQVGNLSYTDGADAETTDKYHKVPYTFGVVGVYDSKTIPNYDGLGGSGAVLSSGLNFTDALGEYDNAERVVVVNHGTISIARKDIASN